MQHCPRVIRCTMIILGVRGLNDSIIRSLATTLPICMKWPNGVMHIHTAKTWQSLNCSVIGYSVAFPFLHFVLLEKCSPSGPPGSGFPLPTQSKRRNAPCARPPRKIFLGRSRSHRYQVQVEVSRLCRTSAHEASPRLEPYMVLRRFLCREGRRYFFALIRCPGSR